MSDKYVMDKNGEPERCNDLFAWARVFERQDRVVARTQVGESEVSTVFLGINHSFGHEPPLLWETMVFGGPMDREMDRCSGKRADAQRMHLEMVERVAKAISENPGTKNDLQRT